MRITTILSSLVFIKFSMVTFSKQFDFIQYSLFIFYPCTLLLLFPRFIVKQGAGKEQVLTERELSVTEVKRQGGTS